MDNKTNKPEEATDTQKKPVAKKRRTRRSTFGPRVTVSYRFPEELHAAMLDYCSDNTTPINSWLVGLVEDSLLAAGYVKHATPPKPKARKIS